MRTTKQARSPMRACTCNRMVPHAASIAATSSTPGDAPEACARQASTNSYSPSRCRRNRSHSGRGKSDTTSSHSRCRHPAQIHSPSPHPRCYCSRVRHHPRAVHHHPRTAFLFLLLNQRSDIRPTPSAQTADDNHQPAADVHRPHRSRQPSTSSRPTSSPFAPALSKIRDLFPFQNPLHPLAECVTCKRPRPTAQPSKIRWRVGRRSFTRSLSQNGA